MAKGEEADRIIGYSTGADDYLPKPFSPTELLVQIRALLRQMMRCQETLKIETSHLQIDLERRSVCLKGVSSHAIPMGSPVESLANVSRTDQSCALKLGSTGI